MAEDEILTGEAVALDLQPLGVGMRALGGLIDLVIAYLLLFLAMWAAGSLADAGVLDQGTVQIYQVTAIVVVFVVIPVAVETLTRGRSLGRLAAGARIVRSDGGAIGFRHAFIRALVGVLEIAMSLGGIAFLVAMFSPRGQRLGDLVAGTYSERTRAPRLPEPAPGVPPELAGWAEVADAARLPARVDLRVTRFASGAARMDPAVRARLAAELAQEVAPFVSPLPPVAPELLLQGVAAIRRDRDRTALRAQAERAARLAG